MTEAPNADANILIVDDEPSIVRLSDPRAASVGYTSVHGFTDPLRGPGGPPRPTSADLIVLDINMPGMTGYDFLNDLSQRLTEDTFLPVLMVSGMSEAETRLQALQAGANNFLTKPIDLKVFLAHVRSLLETRFMSLRVNEVRGVLEELVRRRTAQLQQAHHRDPRPSGPRGRVPRRRHRPAHRPGGPTLRAARPRARPSPGRASLIARTAPLHDLGKVAISDTVLLKKGPFDDDEREIMRKHSALGAKLLSGGTSELVQMAEEIALFHHERWDGRVIRAASRPTRSP